jgi:hypothetical protein
MNHVLKLLMCNCFRGVTSSGRRFKKLEWRQRRAHFDITQVRAETPDIAEDLGHNRRENVKMADRSDSFGFTRPPNSTNKEFCRDRDQSGADQLNQGVAYDQHGY